MEPDYHDAANIVERVITDMQLLNLEDHLSLAMNHSLAACGKLEDCDSELTGDLDDVLGNMNVKLIHGPRQA